MTTAIISDISSYKKISDYNKAPTLVHFKPTYPLRQKEIALQKGNTLQCFLCLWKKTHSKASWQQRAGPIFKQSKNLSLS